MGLIALLCAYLLYGRVRQRGQLRDALLLGVVVLHAITTLFLSVVPGVTGTDRPDALQTCAPLALRLLGTLVFTVAAFVPDRHLRRPTRSAVAVVVKHNDGTDVEIGPGDAYVIEPGHDAWVIGDDAFVGFEFESKSAEEYARG